MVNKPIQLEITICDIKLGRKAERAFCIYRTWCAHVVQCAQQQTSYWNPYATAMPIIYYLSTNRKGKMRSEKNRP